MDLKNNSLYKNIDKYRKKQYKKMKNTQRKN